MAAGGGRDAEAIRGAASDGVAGGLTEPGCASTARSASWHVFRATDDGGEMKIAIKVPVFIVSLLCGGAAALAQQPSKAELDELVERYKPRLPSVTAEGIESLWLDRLQDEPWYRKLHGTGWRERTIPTLCRSLMTIIRAPRPSCPTGTRRFKATRSSTAAPQTSVSPATRVTWCPMPIWMDRGCLTAWLCSLGSRCPFQLQESVLTKSPSCGNCVLTSSCASTMRAHLPEFM